MTVEYRGTTEQRSVQVLAADNLWSYDLRTTGCDETYCGSVSFYVGRVYSGSRPVSIEWLVDGQSTGVSGPWYGGWFPQPAMVTAVLTNPGGGVAQLSYWVRGASPGEEPMRAIPGTLRAARAPAPRARKAP